MLDSLKQRIFRAKQYRWDQEYRHGKWAMLHSLGELGHNSILAGYASFLGVKSVLDVGCGNGQLSRLMHGIDFYAGVDISPAALDQCRATLRSDLDYELIEANFDQHTPPQLKVDLLVFNESLYYSKTPHQTLQAYVGLLNAGGHIAISMFDNSRAPRVWDAVDQLCTTLDQTTVTLDDKTWLCRLLQPQGAPA